MMLHCGLTFMWVRRISFGHATIDVQKYSSVIVDGIALQILCLIWVCLHGFDTLLGVDKCCCDFCTFMVFLYSSYSYAFASALSAFCLIFKLLYCTVALLSVFLCFYVCVCFYVIASVFVYGPCCLKINE